MSKDRGMPFGISLFIIILLLLEVYFFFIDFLHMGLFAHYGYTISSLTHLPYLGVTLFLYILLSIALMVILYGFLNRTSWARKFTMWFLVWAILWTLWALIIQLNIVINLIFLIIYIIMIYYLTTEPVLEYFRPFFRYGDYILYKRTVELKNGKTVIIHFFCRHTPKSGTPTTMPEGYEVAVIERSGLPYLQKIGHKRVYKYGEYTLYTAVITLKNGKTLPIFFFSKKKPKRGKPTTLPKGYSVLVNKRSNLPYLKKTKISKKTELVSKKTISIPPNIVYVVSSPQPGEVIGDWAVRDHKEIISRHKTQKKAVEIARKIALKKQATVLVQRTDGTFGKGIKPKRSK